MVHIKIFEATLQDIRFKKVAVSVGLSLYEVIGRFLEVWFHCVKEHTYYVTDAELLVLMPYPGMIEAAKACGLFVLGEEGVYVSGTRGRIEWYAHVKDAGQKGAAARWSKKNKKMAGAIPDAIAPAMAHAMASAIIFDKLYEKYPKRSGTQNKKKGIELCVKKFKTAELITRLEKAIENYAKHCDQEKKTGTPYVAQFSTFVNGAWEEWVDQKPKSSYRLIPIEEAMREFEEGQ